RVVLRSASLLGGRCRSAESLARPFGVPRAIPPMMATRAATLPSGADWSYEVKWDGYRAQGVKRGASVSLASRNLKNITPQFPVVAQAVARLRAADAVVDGEIVAL